MANQVEQIVLEAEEGPVLQGVAKANAALEKFEKTGARAGSSVGQSFERSGETIIRAMDRSRASAERLVASIEKKAAVAGKTGVERLVAERDQLIRRLAGEERAIERAKVAYDKLIAAQRQAENSNRSFGASIQNFVQAPLQSVGSALSGIVSRLGPVGVATGAIAVGFGVAVKAAVNFVDRMGSTAERLQNLADRTGLTLGQIDKLQAMAKIAGVNVESLETGARTLAEGLADLGSGGDRAREALRKLGVQAYDASGRQREMGQVMLDLLQKLGKVESQAERVALANATLGRGALELLPLIRNYDALEKEAKRLGFGMDEYLLKRLGAASDEVDKLNLQIDLLKRKLAGKLIVAVEFVTKGVEILERPLTARGALAAAGVGGPVGSDGDRPFLLRPPGSPAAGAAARILEEAARRRQGELTRGREISDAFRRRRAASPEGMRARLREIEELQQPIDAALRSDLTESAARQKLAEFNALEREKMDLTARIKALEDARQHAEEQAKRAAKARQEIEHYKYLIGLNASGSDIEIVAPDKELTAATERTMQFRAHEFQSGLQAENARLEEQVRDIEKALQMAKRADEERVSTLEREARLNEQLIRLRTGPGGEAQAIEQTYQMRIEYAQREFGIHKDRWRFEEALQDAEMDRITKIAELERKRFDDLRHAAEGIFDALLTRSQSLGDAILNIFKAAVLTPIKQAFSTMIAGMLMPAHGVAGRGAPAAGGLRSILGLGGLLGGGALPSFGGFGIPGAPGGTPGFAGPVAMGGSSMGGGAPLAAWGAMGATYLAGLKSFAGIGGSVPIGPGMATTWQAATMGQKLSAIGHSNAALLGGGMLAYAGLRRGGLSGLAMTTAGGALIGFKFGGPIGAAIGAGAGALAGFVRLFMKSAEEKLREKIRAVYGVEMRDKGILRQVLDMAKQGFGGNLDVAIRSPQIRDLIELYAMSTGQRMSGLPATMRPVSLLQQGGNLFQQASGGSSFDRIGAGTPSSAGGPIVVNITVPGAKEFFEKETVRVVVDNPRAVQSAAMAATRASAGRREMTGLQLSPGLVLS